MDAANQFGRGTPAGNAIFRLYNKKNMDSTLDPELLARLQKMRKEREAAEAATTKVKTVPKSQARVNVPKFGRRAPKLTEEEMAILKLNAMGHRKREGDIRADMDSYVPELPPAPSKPAVTDADKDRLARIFEHGVDPVRSDAKIELKGANAVRARGHQKPDEGAVLEGRFDELTLLLQEKRAFLQEVKSGLVLGAKSAADRRQLELSTTNEIAAMIAEMKDIDTRLRSLADSTRSSS